MLISFTVGNFRSFKSEKSLSMEAAPIKEHATSVFHAGKRKLLPMAVLYGANSSGKSNLLQAVATMKHIVMGSVRLNPGDAIDDYTPFMLDTYSRNQPASFEMEFTIDDDYYRYGFEYDARLIHSEWLFERQPGEKEYNLFLRSGNVYSISNSRFHEGKGKEENTADNRLFLSLVAQLRGAKAMRVMEWFSKITFISGLDAHAYEQLTYMMLRGELKGAQSAMTFFKDLQLGFNAIRVQEKDLPDDYKKALAGAPMDFRKKIERERFMQTLTKHDIYDNDGKVVGTEEFDEESMESEGTKKLIKLSGPLFDALGDGKVLLVDELDAKLHPILTRNIIMLFNDPVHNPKGAQLIFATHDTNLLNIRYVRRDQVWFAEKDACSATDLYSLVEFKDNSGNKVRNDSSFEKDYINGRFGAIPYIGG